VARNKENLALLRDYSESLAYSAMDWYLDHQKKKKKTAQYLHWIIYSLVAIAGLFPLLKLTTVDILGSCANAKSSDLWCGLSSHAAEAALLFIGFAGGFKLWDTYGGYTVDWMRFMTSAARINRELAKFQFDWEKIDLKSSDKGTDDGPAGATAPQPAAGPDADLKSNPSDSKGKFEVCPSCGPCHPVRFNPTELKVKLAGEFCSKILDLVGEEISVWATELKKRMDLMPAHSVGHGK
jgi:hypothetical protein